MNRRKEQAAIPAHPDAILAALADETRLRVFSALVNGTTDSQAVADSLGLTPQKVAKALTRLTTSGLAKEKDGAFVPVTRAFAEALRISAERQKDEFPGVDEKTAEELGRFIRNGKLTRLPEARPKRLLVLDYIARWFDPGVYYPERLVNAILRRFSPDTATLRRFLVDEGFLDRKASKYWRTGGSVPDD